MNASRDDHSPCCDFRDPASVTDSAIRLLSCAKIGEIVKELTNPDNNDLAHDQQTEKKA
jgi:hypothetical protein